MRKAQEAKKAYQVAQSAIEKASRPVEKAVLKDSASITEVRSADSHIPQMQAAPSRDSLLVAAAQKKLQRQVSNDEFKQKRTEHELEKVQREEGQLLKQLQVETKLRKADEAYEAGVDAQLKERRARVESRSAAAASRPVS